MTPSRRHLLQAAVAAPAILTFGLGRNARAATTLKISHQFPGGTSTKAISATACVASSRRRSRSGPTAPS